MIHSAEFKYKWDNNQRRDNLVILRRILLSKVSHFEEELPKLKETTTILELASWKLRIYESIQAEKMMQDNNVLSIWRQSRITCGADVIIRHALLYLIVVGDEESDSYIESDSYVFAR
jgi:hypothetical protein